MAVNLCQICQKPFEVTHPSRVYCGPTCRETGKRLASRKKARAEYASWKKPATVGGRAAYKPCQDCAHWQVVNDPAYELGGWCRREALNACRPWGEARLRQAVTA